MSSGSPKEGPLVQFIIICVALVGTYHYGGTLINENRLNHSIETTVGTVIDKEKKRRSNTVYYDYFCEADKCLTGQQGVSKFYYGRLKKNDEVVITYVNRRSKNLTRIEKRPAVFLYSLALTLFMFGIFIYYGRMLKRNGGL